MKKIINNPDDFVEESIKGLVNSYPEIYKFCVKNNERVLVIGDNIRTDIKGANNMNFDSLFITSGIHKDEFQNIPLESYDKILMKYKAKTNYYQERLTW